METLPSLLGTLLDGPFEDTARPEPVPGDLRIAWGVSLVLLMLGGARGRKASLQKLHFLAHATRTEDARFETRQVFDGARSPADIFMRVEPWLNRALALAAGARLIAFSGKSATLSDRGLAVLKNLMDDEYVMTEEKAFLKAIAARATEQNVEAIMKMENIR